MATLMRTGWGQEKDRQASRRSGIDHHLIKPVDFDPGRRHSLTWQSASHGSTEVAIEKPERNLGGRG